MLDRIAWLIVTCGGLGAARYAPGTFGTLGGIAIAAAVIFLTPAAFGWLNALAICLVVACVFNVLLGPWCERRFGGKDPQAVVIDEVAGVLLTLLIAPQREPVWLGLLLSFLAFRVFDITKPPPAPQLEKLPHGWGVLCDDLLAGVYAGAALRLLGVFFTAG